MSELVDASAEHPAEELIDHHWHRLHPVSALVHAFRGLAVLLFVSTSALIQAGVWGFLGAIGLLVIGTVGYAVSWRYQRFRIGEIEVEFRSGVFNRKVRRIPIDRLETADVAQPILARFAGLASLKLEAAAQGSTDIALEYLRHDVALDLREQILDRRRYLRTHGAPADRVETDAASFTATDGADEAAADPALARPAIDLAGVGSNADLVKSRLLEMAAFGTMMTAVLVLVFAGIYTLDQRYDLGDDNPPDGEVVGRDGNDYIFLSPEGEVERFPVDEYDEDTEGSPLTVALPLIVALVGIAGPMLGRIDKFWDFRIGTDDDGFVIQRGLLHKEAQRVVANRIQAARLKQHFLWRRFGWYSVEIDVAGLRGSAGASETSTLLPVGDRATALAMVASVMDLDLDEVELEPVPAEASRRSFGRWRDSLGVAVTDEHVVTRRGYLMQRTDVVPKAKAQSLRVTQGPWQRQLGLATFHVDTPGDQVTPQARHRHVAQCLELAERLRAAG